MMASLQSDGRGPKPNTGHRALLQLEDDLGFGVMFHAALDFFCLKSLVMLNLKP